MQKTDENELLHKSGQHHHHSLLQLLKNGQVESDRHNKQFQDLGRRVENRQPREDRASSLDNKNNRLRQLFQILQPRINEVQMFAMHRMQNQSKYPPRRGMLDVPEPQLHRLIFILFIVKRIYQ